MGRPFFFGIPGSVKLSGLGLLLGRFFISSFLDTAYGFVQAGEHSPVR